VFDILFYYQCQVFTSLINQAINQFTLLADASDDMPDLSNHHSYADFHLSWWDWECLKDIMDALRVCFLSLILI